MTQDSFPRTPQNTVKRVPKRGAYDKATIYPIIDAAFLCHVSFVVDGQPFIIPTLHARDEDTILLHGATTSRLMQHAQSGAPLAIAVTHIDGLVLARSVFNHSINYRSAVVFGCGTLVESYEDKMNALALFTEKLLPGRWADSRLPSANEMKATSVIAVAIENASGKVRVGDPGDDEEDINLPFWSGVLPVSPLYGAPLPAPNLPAGIELPAYITDYIAQRNGQSERTED